MKVASLLLIFGLFIFTSCEDILEEDIDSDTVQLISPPNNYSTENPQITFWWEEIDGAEAYELQVVSPRFSFVEQLILDSTANFNKINKTLDPGEYEWRVRALNDGSETNYTTRSFTIN